MSEQTYKPNITFPINVIDVLSRKLFIVQYRDESTTPPTLHNVPAFVEDWMAAADVAMRYADEKVKENKKLTIQSIMAGDTPLLT